MLAVRFTGGILARAACNISGCGVLWTRGVCPLDVPFATVFSALSPQGFLAAPGTLPQVQPPRVSD